mmetsp:Transcript_1847/g.2586  ORF Transcript_1847/g.2586 Transcript_1847/m.2586 type:complete len:125 (-) Transcript_1847:383-757(-)
MERQEMKQQGCVNNNYPEYKEGYAEDYKQEYDYYYSQEGTSYAQHEDYFTNHGLLLWEKRREEWLRLSRGGGRPPGTRAKNLDIDRVIDSIFSPAAKGHLPESTPLPQMVDLLVDMWEAEGLFD